MEEKKEDIKEEKIIYKEYVNFSINGKMLKNILKLNAVATTEIKLNLSNDKINISVVDPAHVEMILTEIDKSVFIEYEIKTDSPDQIISLSFDVDKLLNALKTVKKEDMFKLKYESEIDKNAVNIVIGAFNQKISLIDPDSIPESKCPLFILNASFDVVTSDLKDFLDKADHVSDYFSIETSTDKVLLNASGDTDQINFIPTVQNLRSNSVHKSKFSIDYFLTAIKELKTLFNSLTVEIDNDHPVRITGLKDKLKIIILIAPRIEAE